MKLWNPNTGVLLKTYAGHGNEVTDAAGSCESSHLVSASLDKSVIYWDVSTGLPVRRLRGHAGGINCVRFNEDSSVAVSGARDNSVMCWDIRTRKLDAIQTMRDAKDCITSLIVTDHKIISGSLDGTIRYYDIRAGELCEQTIGRPITYIVQTKDGQCILAACSDNRLRLVDSDSGQILSEYHGHKTDDYQIECGILKDDSHVISGSAQGSAIIWDLVEGNVTGKLNMGYDVVHSLTTHPNKNELIFAQKREIQIWGAPKHDLLEYFDENT